MMVGFGLGNGGDSDLDEEFSKKIRENRRVHKFPCYMLL